MKLLLESAGEHTASTDSTGSSTAKTARQSLAARAVLLVIDLIKRAWQSGSGSGAEPSKVRVLVQSQINIDSNRLIVVGRELIIKLTS